MTVSPTLDARFREAAAAAGLLDVAYDLAETPIGTLLVATTDRGLCRISYDPQPEREAESLSHTFGVRVLRATKPIASRVLARTTPTHWIACRDRESRLFSLSSPAVDRTHQCDSCCTHPARLHWYDRARGLYPQRALAAEQVNRPAVCRIA